MIWVWLGLTVGLIVIECLTVDLVAIWFALSALVMVLIVGFVPTLPTVWQVVIFLAIATLLVLSTRKAMKKLLAKNKSKETNLGLIVGHKAMVVTEIDNDLEKGEVKINGLVWNARSQNGNVIEKDVQVIIKRIDGNKLIVERETNVETDVE